MSQKMVLLVVVSALLASNISCMDNGGEASAGASHRRSLDELSNTIRFKTAAGENFFILATEDDDLKTIKDRLLAAKKLDKKLFDVEFFSLRERVKYIRRMLDANEKYGMVNVVFKAKGGTSEAPKRPTPHEYEVSGDARSSSHFLSNSFLREPEERSILLELKGRDEGEESEPKKAFFTTLNRTKFHVNILDPKTATYKALKALLVSAYKSLEGTSEIYGTTYDLKVMYQGKETTDIDLILRVCEHETFHVTFVTKTV